jgi:EmrB/QacA subfamily drug resistance transporter
MEATRRWEATLTAFFCGIALILISVELTGVSLALPRIASDLHLHLDSLSWILNGYQLTWAIVMIPAGHLGARIGTKKVFLFGVTLFVIGSVIGGFAQDYEMLLAARFLQGVGAASLLPGATALAYVLFPADERGFPVGIVTMCGCLGLAVGPTVSGYLVHYVSWRWVFFVNVPLGALVFILVGWFAKEIPLRKITGRNDWLGTLFLALTLICSMLFFSEFTHWSTAVLTGLVVIAAIFFWLFVRVQKQHENPIIPKHLLQLRSFKYSCFARVTTNLVMVAVLFVGPLYYQNILGFTADKSGLLFLPMTLLFALLSFVAGKLCKRVSHNKLIQFGMIFLIIANLFGFFLNLESTLTFIITTMMLFGFGLGFSLPVITAHALGNVPEEETAIASAIFYLFAVIGNASGPLLATLGLSFLGRYQASSLLGAKNTPQLLQKVTGLFSGATPVDKLPGKLLEIAQHSFLFAMHWVFIGAALLVVLGMVFAYIATREQSL